MERESFDILGKRVTVLGAARSGVAVAKLLSSEGAHVFLSEKMSAQKKQTEADALSAASIDTEFGGHTSRIYDADLWVVSPGIPLSNPIFQEAKKKRIPVVGELEAASWFCRSPVVAVTGSNGKSTTTAWLGEVFRQAGKPCVVAGNIGEPFSDHVSATVPNGVAVLEVSSFQLETTWAFHPHVAILLNLTPDHLDRHGSMAHYGALKARIFENQEPSDFVIYNAQDALVSGLVQRAKSRKIAFGAEDAESWYGLNRDGVLVIRLQSGEEEIVPVGDMRLPGDHNIANGLAVALTARLLGIDLKSIRDVFRRFKGLSHRMEFVREVDGVAWVNDSKATNTDSVWYALGSFGRPIVLIAGGRDKDSDFTTLRERVEERVRGVVLMGEAAEKIEKALEGFQPVVIVSSLEEAVACAREIARTGDVVLLSPGCASFDMFRDFEDRGDRFKKLVGNL